MKKYNKPELELILLYQDVILASEVKQDEIASNGENTLDDWL